MSCPKFVRVSVIGSDIFQSDNNSDNISDKNSDKNSDKKRHRRSSYRLIECKRKKKMDTWDFETTSWKLHVGLNHIDSCTRTHYDVGLNHSYFFAYVDLNHIITRKNLHCRLMDTFHDFFYQQNQKATRAGAMRVPRMRATRTGRLVPTEATCAAGSASRAQSA